MFVVTSPTTACSEGCAISLLVSSSSSSSLSLFCCRCCSCCSLAAMRGSGIDVRAASRPPLFAWFASIPVSVPGSFAHARAACTPCAFFLRYSFGIGWGAPTVVQGHPSLFLACCREAGHCLSPDPFLSLLAYLPAVRLCRGLAACDPCEFGWFFGSFTALSGAS